MPSMMQKCVAGLRFAFFVLFHPDVVVVAGFKEVDDAACVFKDRAAFEFQKPYRIGAFVIGRVAVSFIAFHLTHVGRRGCCEYSCLTTSRKHDVVSDCSGRNVHPYSSHALPSFSGSGIDRFSGSILSAGRAWTSPHGAMLCGTWTPSAETQAVTLRAVLVVLRVRAVLKS